MNKNLHKNEFESQLKSFVEGLQVYVSTDDGQWTVKGFIDVFQNVYTISSDTKIVSKILEIHLFPKILEFAQQFGYKIVGSPVRLSPTTRRINRSEENIPNG